MKKTYRILALLLALVLAMGALSGCTPKEKDDSTNPGKNQQGQNTNDNPAIADPDGYSYVSSYSKLEMTDSEGLYNVQYAAGRLWYTTSKYESNPVYDDNGNIIDDTGTSKTFLWSMNPDGTDNRQLENFASHTPEEGDGWQNSYSYVQNITAGPDGSIWIVEGYSANRNNAPENIEPYSEQWYNYQEYKNGAYIEKLDETGAAVTVIDTADLAGEDNPYFYVNRVVVDSQGRLLVFSDMSVYILSTEGEKLGAITLDSYASSVIQLRDGTILLSTYKYDELTGEGKDSFYKLDVDGQKLGDEVEIPTSIYAYGYMAGAGEYDLYCRTQNGFNGIKIADGTNEELFNFINADVDSSNINNIVPLDDGSFIALSNEWNESGMQTSIVKIYKVKNSEIPVKTILTFACMYLNYNVRREILNFNRSSDKYRIKVIDYSQYNTNDDYEAGLTKLTTELLAGNIPDMFDTNQLPINRLAAKGYLEDLTPYIEADSEIGGMAGLVQPIIEAIKSADGKLYFTAPTAYLTTVAAPTSIVADLVHTRADGSVYWTIDDVLTAYSRMPEGADIFNKYATKADMLRELTTYVMDDLINWSTGECRFNSEDFINILKFADLFRKDQYDWENHEYDPEEDDEAARFRNGKQLLNMMQISDFIEWRQYEKLMGGDITFVGFPTNGTSGSAWNISDNGNIAMSTRCSDKDGAWSFMRTFLTKEFQESSYGIPTNKAVFDSKLNEACTPEYEDVYDDNGNVTGKVETPKSWYWYGNGGGVVYAEDDAPAIAASTITGASEMYPEDQCIFALDNTQRAKIETLMNSTTHTSTADESITTIILEEAEPFFDGKQTAEQTAETIQRRLNLYVNEQR